MGSLSPATEYDVIVIGGGFAGCTSLHKLRDAGFSVHLFEAGAALGGVWHWNRYPGCRVDTETPFYQMTNSELFRDWSWSSRFPDERELKAYFQHVDKVLGLSKDITYNSVVTGADFDVQSARWTITTDKGERATCKWLVPAAGNTHIRYTPSIQGMESFKGRLIHTADWPADKVDFAGKRVAIVGTGATGVQCVQEIAKEPHLGKLTVYVRNPNYALPMVQRPLSKLDNIIARGSMKGTFSIARQHPAGMATDTQPLKWGDVSASERRRYYEELFERGGFGFQAAAYSDFLVNEEANRDAYNFWREKVLSRLRDQKKKDILAPEEPPFPLGTKRSSLEQDYYECLDRDSTEVVSVKETPFKCFSEKGIVTEDGTEREHDIVLMATGFDNMTGSLTRMGLRGKDGVDMKDRWREGVYTSLGLMASGNPNMFMVFGPHAPTAFANAPIFIELQVNIIAEMLCKLRDEGVRTIEARRASEEAWKGVVNAINDATLFSKCSATSWYLGTNIPGKKAEQLNYLGGMQEYEKACRAELEDWKTKCDVTFEEGKKAPAMAEEVPTLR